MCKPTQQIIFCTCDFKDELPDNYWVLHRFVEGKNEILIGEPILEYSPAQEFHEMKAALLNRLNAPNSFDKPMHFQDGDVMVVSISFFPQFHAFKYADQTWNEFSDFEQFSLARQYEEIRNGNIDEDWVSTTFSVLGMGRN